MDPHGYTGLESIEDRPSSIGLMFQDVGLSFGRVKDHPHESSVACILLFQGLGVGERERELFTLHEFTLV